MIQTAIWIPPSLCGCKFQMTADFTDGSVIDGISYRHPAQFTITDLRLISVCDKHKEHALSMPDTSVLMEIDNITGESYQRRGYLKHPIAQPTEAECLYQYFWSHLGQIRRFPCGCQSHVYVDGRGKDAVHTHLAHPDRTKKCRNHKHDSHDMKKAAADFALLHVTSGEG